MLYVLLSCCLNQFSVAASRACNESALDSDVDKLALTTGLVGFDIDCATVDGCFSWGNILSGSATFAGSGGLFGAMDGLDFAWSWPVSEDAVSSGAETEAGLLTVRAGSGVRAAAGGAGALPL